MPPPKRPGSIIAAAVILFLVGGFSLVAGCCGIAMTGALLMAPDDGLGQPNNMQDPRQVQKALAKEVPGFYAVSISITTVDILLGAIQVLGGILILKLSSAGRWMAIGATLMKLLVSFGSHAYQLFFVTPFQLRLMQADMNKNMPQGGAPFDMGLCMQISTGGAVLAVVIIQLAIVIAILWCLSTAGARRAFAGVAAANATDDLTRPSPRYEGYDDDEAGPSSTGIKDPDR